MGDAAVSSQEILGRIQRELTVAMGPLAPVVLKDKAAEFNEDIDDFPGEKIAELVEEVSFEIQNHRRKLQFQRAALKVLREVPLPSPAAGQTKAASDRSQAESSEKSVDGRVGRLRLRLADDKPPERKA